MSEEDMINPLELLGENEYLRNQLQQKENIIKEVREYINNHLYMESTGGYNIQHLMEK